MRVLFFCLLLLNVVVAASAVFRKEASQVSARFALADAQDPGEAVGSLVLADAMETDAHAPANLASRSDEWRGTAESRPTAPSAENAVPAVDATNASEESRSGLGEPAVEEAAQLAPETVVPGGEKPRLPLAEPLTDIRTQTETADGAGQTADMSSAAPVQRDMDATQQPPAAAIDANVATSPICARVGPFAEQADAVGLPERSGFAPGSVDVEPVEVADKPIYWVHVPPLPSAQDAQRTQRRLAGEGIESFVISDLGPLHNGISLGVFRDPTSAERLAEARKDIGYPVAIHEAQRKHTAFFLNVRIDPPDEAMLQALERQAAELSGEARVATANCTEIGRSNIAGSVTPR